MSIFYKESWNSELMEIDLQKGKRKGPVLIRGLELTQNFKEQVPISTQKYNDLKGLCKKNIIPKEFHGYYLNIKNGKEKRNCLDEPDIEEEVDEFDN